MQISIALATYNGAKYLNQQLNSFAEQIRLPDELVICDDASSDATVQIINEFATHATFPVRLHINEKNLGLFANFERAIILCSGDIIALSDQDDIWHEDKLAKYEHTFNASPSASAVFSDAEVVDKNLSPLGYTLWEVEKFTESERRLFRKDRPLKVLLRHNVVQGASMAFRADLRQALLPIPTNLSNRIWVHDGWFAFLIAAISNIALIERPLMKYRQHEKNHIGVHNRNDTEFATKNFYHSALKLWSLLNNREQLQPFPPKHYQDAELLIEQLKMVVHRLQSLEEQDLRSTTRATRLIEDKIGHLCVRSDLPLPIQYRVIPILRELISGRYSRWSNGLRDAVRDLLQERLMSQ